MRVTVDLGACQGHGVCHMSAPDVFEADAQLGADSCPERAITVS